MERLPPGTAARWPVPIIPREAFVHDPLRQGGRLANLNLTIPAAQFLRFDYPPGDAVAVDRTTLAEAVRAGKRKLSKVLGADPDAEAG